MRLFRRRAVGGSSGPLRGTRWSYPVAYEHPTQGVASAFLRALADGEADALWDRLSRESRGLLEHAADRDQTAVHHRRPERPEADGHHAHAGEARAADGRPRRADGRSGAPVPPGCRDHAGQGRRGHPRRRHDPPAARRRDRPKARRGHVPGPAGGGRREGRRARGRDTAGKPEGEKKDDTIEGEFTEKPN